MTGIGTSPMRAAELYRRARQVLDPVLRPLGFRRTPGVSAACWMRAEGDDWLVIVFQSSDTNGSFPTFRFTLELSIGAWPMPFSGARARLPELLTPAERDQLWAMEHRTFVRLPPPDPAWIADQPEGQRERLVSRYEPRTEPYPPTEDVWFHHADAVDVETVLAFIARVLPGAIERFLADAARPTSTDEAAWVPVDQAPADDQLAEMLSGLGLPVPRGPEALGEARALSPAAGVTHADPELERLVSTVTLGPDAAVWSYRAGRGGPLGRVLAGLGVSPRDVTVVEAMGTDLVATVYSVHGIEAASLLDPFARVLPKPPGSGPWRPMTIGSIPVRAAMRPTSVGVAAFGAVDGYVVWLAGDPSRLEAAMQTLTGRLRAARPTRSP